MSESSLHDEPFEARLVSRETAFAGRVWDIRRDVARYGDSTITREYVAHTGAVAVLALDDDDRVMLIKQYRQPLGMKDWEIPAGLLDVSGEAALDGAKRELGEEVDLVAERWDLLADLATSPGGSNEIVRVYLARGISPTETRFDRTEEEFDLEKRWVPLDEVVQAVLDRTVSNSILIAAALVAQAMRARDWHGLGDANAPWPGRQKGDG
jgi:ADP-ribose pyrophosphatase